MPSAAALRIEIERALERRFPAALSPVPRTIHEVCETGIDAVDDRLGGGLPVGAISELTGPASSGRTSLALQFVASRTREDRACAWVDVRDAFDPESAAANGVRLKQLLWVRCRDEGAGSGLTNQLEPPVRPRFVAGQCVMHRKADICSRKNIPQGLEPCGLRGSFGPAQAAPFYKSLDARIRQTLPEAPIPSAALEARLKPCSFKTTLTPQTSRGVRTQGARTMWTRLDQGLRATDLLLQAGGFAAIVLDLGDTAPEQANRIPAATWFRYRQAAERTQCCLVVLGKRGYAQSAAGVVLECAAVRADAAGGNAAGGTVLRGFEFAVRRGRERFAPVEITTRKPGSATIGLHRGGGKPPAATWQADAAWEAERRA